MRTYLSASNGGLIIKTAIGKVIAEDRLANGIVLIGDDKNMKEKELMDKVNEKAELPKLQLPPIKGHELPEYKSHKIIRSAKIVAINPEMFDGQNTQIHPGALEVLVDSITYCITPSSTFWNRCAPIIGGYYVVYEDGFDSYSPEKAFMNGYTRINEGDAQNVSAIASDHIESKMDSTIDHLLQLIAIKAVSISLVGQKMCEHESIPIQYIQRLNAITTEAEAIGRTIDKLKSEIDHSNAVAQQTVTRIKETPNFEKDILEQILTACTKLLTARQQNDIIAAVVNALYEYGRSILNAESHSLADEIQFIFFTLLNGELDKVLNAVQAGNTMTNEVDNILNEVISKVRGLEKSTEVLISDKQCYSESLAKHDIGIGNLT